MEKRSSESRVSDLSVALIGYGSIGSRHVDNLGRLGVTRRIIVRRASGANPRFQPPDGAAVVHSIQAALENQIDLAIVANPTSLHTETALELIAAGIPVLIEKPISHDLTLATQLADAAEQRAVMAGMAYSMRYHPAYRLARSTLQSQRLGKVLYAKAWFESYLPAWHPWEDYRQSYAARPELGGGVLPTVDHEIDFLNWCFGRPETALGAQTKSGALEAEVDDVAMLAIRYPRGVLASVTLSLCRHDRDRGFEIVGSRGSLRYSTTSEQLEIVAADGWRETAWKAENFDMNDVYVAMLGDFLNAVARGDQHAPVPVEAGLDALRASEPCSTIHE